MDEVDGLMFSGITETWFWIVTLAAGVGKVFMSEHHSIGRAFLTVGAAIFFAVVFTDVAAEMTGLQSEAGRAALAAALALLGEEVTRAILRLLKSDDFLERIVKAWRGK